MSRLFGFYFLLTTSFNSIAFARVTKLKKEQIESYIPFSNYAAAAYCSLPAISSWNCGAPCEANPSFQVVAFDNDEEALSWYVGYDSDLKSIIVSHQGADFSKLEPELTNENQHLSTFDPSFFPGLPSSVEASSVFLEPHKKIASSILAAVEKTSSAYSSEKITLVGHGFGAAIALLDSVYLPLHFPSTFSFETVTYGLPRVGNMRFADHLDEHAHITHINNMKDPIPILPGRFLGFHHPKGEIHIDEKSDWNECSGQDNPSDRCVVGDVPNIFEGVASDHEGPYGGVLMNCDK